MRAKCLISCLTCGLYGVDSPLDEETHLLKKDESGSAEEMIAENAPTSQIYMSPLNNPKESEEQRPVPLMCTSQGCLPRGGFQGYQHFSTPHLDTYPVIVNERTCKSHLLKLLEHNHPEGDVSQTQSEDIKDMLKSLGDRKSVTDLNGNAVVPNRTDASEITTEEGSRSLRYTSEGHFVASEENVLVNSPLWRQMQELNSPQDIRPPAPSMY